MAPKKKSSSKQHDQRPQCACLTLQNNQCSRKVSEPGQKFCKQHKECTKLMNKRAESPQRRIRGKSPPAAPSRSPPNTKSTSKERDVYAKGSSEDHCVSMHCQGIKNKTSRDVCLHDPSKWGKRHIKVTNEMLHDKRDLTEMLDCWKRIFPKYEETMKIRKNARR